MRNNPFVFGKIVKGPSFLDRTQLRKELATEILNSTNIILYSPRRYGKTSLILQTFEDLRRKNKKFSGLMVDFYRVNTKDKFIEILADEYGRQSGLTFEKLLSFFKNVFTGVVPSIEMDQFGNPKIKMQFTPGQSDRLLNETLKLPKKLADSGKLVCVFFDEFQEISVLNGNDFQKELRAEIQHHDNVSYIFSGSKYHLFKDIFERENSPLYHIGKSISLKPIEEKYYVPYMIKKFSEIGYSMDKKTVALIYNIANSIPYYVQMLAHEMYNLALLNKKSDSSELVQKAQDNILANKNEEFLIIYENMNLSSQITLDIIIRNEGKALFRQAILSQYPIAASTLKKALNSLITNGTLVKQESRYYFQDVFFERWLKKRL